MLNFIDKLDEEQALNAEKVAKAAKRAGVDPVLAVAIAFKESSLRSNPPRGADGEIGMMQVIPSTGRGMGYNEKQLGNLDQNIEAGIQYLKKGLEATGNDPQLAAIYYNGGPGAVQAMTQGKDPDPRVFDYLRLINSYGTFADQPAAESNKQPGAEVNPPPPTETDTERDARIQAAMDAQEKRQAQLIGGGVGVGVSATRAAGSGAGAALEAGARRVGAGFRTGMQGGLPGGTPNAPAGVPSTPGAAPQGGLSIMQQPAAGGPLSNVQPTGSQATRILQGTIGDEGTTGRARTTGFNTQTAQEAAQQKEMQRMFSNLQRTGAVADDASTFFARQPGMTASPSGVLIPRSDAPVTLGPRGPQGQIGFTRPAAPPPPAPPSLASRAASGLEYVSDMFRGMMRPVASTAQAVGRYVMPPLAMASAAGEGVNIAQQLRRPEDERDLTGMALSAGNILGSGLSMFPATAPVGVPLMLGTGAAQAYRSSPEAQQFIKKKLEAAGDMPYSDPMTGYAP